VDRHAWYDFFATLTVFADVAIIVLVGWLVVARFSAGARDRLLDLRVALASSGLAIAALITTTAMAGSLYLSEVAHLVPCRLCWYQRIAMYSLAVLLIAAAIRRDRNIRFYGMLLASLGTLVSTYHYLVERFPSLERGVSCDPSNPCSVTLIWELHFISIPFMAGSAFVLAFLVLALTPPERGRPRRGRAGGGVRDARARHDDVAGVLTEV
jgi:disulfide bond formation protein DsbB